MVARRGCFVTSEAFRLSPDPFSIDRSASIAAHSLGGFDLGDEVTPSRFDIYTRKDGRWSRRESFEGADQDAAVAAAVSMDAAGTFDGVRVMSVVDYGGDRPPLETLAWISPHLSKVASVQRQLKNAAAKATRSEAPVPPPPPPPMLISPPMDPEPLKSPAKRSRPARKPEPDIAAEVERWGAAQLTGRLIGNALIALVIAAVAFVPLTVMMKKVGPEIGIEPASQGPVGLGLTVIVFVTAAALLMGRIYRAYMSQPVLEPLPVVGGATPVRRVSERRPGRPPRVNEDNSKARTPRSRQPAQEKPASVSEGMAFGENARRVVLEFLAMAIAAVKDEVPVMNQHVSFGLNLFSSGAAERYGEYSGLSRMQSFVLVREVVSALGNSPDRVDAFCRQYGDYAGEERYNMMISSGKRVMDKQLAGDDDPFSDFRDVLQLWTSDSAARAQSQGIVCIMFTDIVGSTAMTHEKGDYAAQEVVRVHNAIVRSALAAHHGREVKHTGDGIMASFTLAANAVRGTIDIRDALAMHNRMEGQVPVNVRIGLNAGEAVQEEDDFFGTTVQLAARVCDKAGTGEIFVTDNVRELSKGHGLTFEDAGQYEMKGVPVPMTLYRVGGSDQS